MKQKYSYLSFSDSERPKLKINISYNNLIISMWRHVFIEYWYERSVAKRTGTAIIIIIIIIIIIMTLC